MIVVIAPDSVGKLMESHFQDSINHVQDSIKYVEMPELKNVLKNLRTHTDMGLHAISNGLIIEPSIFDEMERTLISIGVSKEYIQCGAKTLEEKYPEDIAYNCVALGDHFFYHQKTDSKIVSSYQFAGVSMHIVKQGYAKCATLVVGENAVITEDLNLYSNFIGANVETLLIPKGEILLKGFEYGFIGGAGGLHKGRLFLNGSLKHHSHENEMRDFIKAQGTEIVELHQQKLEDCGSIFILDF